MSFYSAFRETLVNRSWPPKGMPAVHNLLSEISKDLSVDVLFICRQPISEFKNRSMVNFAEIPNVNFHISPYRCVDVKGLKGFIANTFHLLFILKFYFMRYQFIYCDREQVTFGALFSLFHKNVILRLHGVANFNTKKLFKCKIFPRIKMFAFKAPFSRVICSIDGSPGLDFIKKRCRKKVKYNLLYNGVDIASEPREFKQINEETQILSVGRLDKSKGLDLLIDGLNEVKEKKWQCVIIGSGEEEEFLKAKVLKFGLENRILFKGALNHSQVSTFLENSDIFVSFNKYGNQSNSVLEAMNCGKCILTYDYCKKFGRDSQFSTDFELKESLVFVANETPEEVVEKLKLLLDNPNIVSEKSRKMKSYAEKNILSWNERVKIEIKLCLE